MFKLTQRLLILPNYYAAFRSTALEFHTTGCVLARRYKRPDLRHARNLVDNWKNVRYAGQMQNVRNSCRGGRSQNFMLDRALRMELNKTIRKMTDFK